MKLIFVLATFFTVSEIKAAPQDYEVRYISVHPVGKILLQEYDARLFNPGELTSLVRAYDNISRAYRYRGSPQSIIDRVRALCSSPGSQGACNHVSRIEGSYSARVANQQPAEVKVMVEESVAIVTPPAQVPETIQSPAPAPIEAQPVVEPVVARQPIVSSAPAFRPRIRGGVSVAEK